MNARCPKFELNSNPADPPLPIAGAGLPLTLVNAALAPVAGLPLLPQGPFFPNHTFPASISHATFTISPVA